MLSAINNIDEYSIIIRTTEHILLLIFYLSAFFVMRLRSRLQSVRAWVYIRFSLIAVYIRYSPADGRPSPSRPPGRSAGGREQPNEADRLLRHEPRVEWTPTENMATVSIRTHHIRRHLSLTHSLYLDWVTVSTAISHGSSRLVLVMVDRVDHWSFCPCRRIRGRPTVLYWMTGRYVLDRAELIGSQAVIVVGRIYASGVDSSISDGLRSVGRRSECFEQCGSTR